MMHAIYIYIYIYIHIFTYIIQGILRARSFTLLRGAFSQKSCGDCHYFYKKKMKKQINKYIYIYIYIYM